MATSEYLKSVRLQTTYGYFDIEVWISDSTTSSIPYPSGRLLHSSLLSVGDSSTTAAISVYTPFEFLGQNSARYEVNIGGTRNRDFLLSVGSETIDIGLDSTQQHNRTEVPVIIINEERGKIGWGTKEIFSEDYDEFYSYEYTQVFPNSFGTADIIFLSDNALSTSWYDNDSNRGKALLDILGAAEPIVDDPYAAGGTSGTGGGGGTFSITDEGFSVPNLPTISAVDTGFTTIFNPTVTQLKNLAYYMWTNPLFDLSNWKAIFANPMDAILGLSIFPIEIPAGAGKTVSVGNISTDVTMTLAASEWVSKDCGTITIPEYWGAYLDYAPYTKLEMYLPYVGFIPLDTDDVIGKPLGVVYHADIVSGAGVAFVTVNGKVHYSHNCMLSVSIPVNGDNFSRIISGLIGVTSGAVQAVAGAATGNAGGALNGVGQAASGVMDIVKPQIQRGGALPTSSGFLGVKYPFVCITRPRQCVPVNQNKFIGYPVYDNVQLGEITGYTEIDSIHLETIPATETELAELETLLGNGVIL